VVRSLKAEQSRKAYVRFETEPALQAQVDFGEFAVTQPDGSVKKYYLFALIWATRACFIASCGAL